MGVTALLLLLGFGASKFHNRSSGAFDTYPMLLGVLSCSCPLEGMQTHDVQTDITQKTSCSGGDTEKIGYKLVLCCYTQKG